MWIANDLPLTNQTADSFWSRLLWEQTEEEGIQIITLPCHISGRRRFLPLHYFVAISIKNAGHVLDMCHQLEQSTHIYPNLTTPQDEYRTSQIE